MTQPVQMTPEEFSKTWPGFKGQPSTITPGKTLDPLAPWQIAVACRFAEAYYQYRSSLGERVEEPRKLFGNKIREAAKVIRASGDGGKE